MTAPSQICDRAQSNLIPDKSNHYRNAFTLLIAVGPTVTEVVKDTINTPFINTRSFNYLLFTHNAVGPTVSEVVKIVKDTSSDATVLKYLTRCARAQSNITASS